MSLPKYLYKYRRFSEFTLKELTDQEVYYSKPSALNDPLECKPVFNNDLRLDQLEKLTFEVLKLSVDPTTSRKRIGEYRYSASQWGPWDDGKEGQRDYEDNLMRVIEADVLASIGDIGVLSLADKWNSMLMWSHYANEHRGICLEFETTSHKCADLQKVEYNSPRAINLSEIYRWRVTHKSDIAAFVKQKVIFTKADTWSYEGEWRTTSAPPGAFAAPLMLKGIYFGARCDSSIITTIVKLFAGSEIAPDFWQLALDNAGGQLHRHPVDTGYLDAFGVRKSLIFAEADFDAMVADLAVLEDEVTDDE